MLPATALRSALLLAITLTGYVPGAAATEAESKTIPFFAFPACVESCVLATGCKLDDPKCMCKTSPALFLESVVRCMFRICTSRTISPESSFISIMEASCAAVRSPLPKEAVQIAKSLAASLASKLPPVTTPTTSATQRAPSSAPATTTTVKTPSSGTSRGGGKEDKDQTTSPTSSTVRSPATTTTQPGDGGNSSAAPEPSQISTSTTSEPQRKPLPPSVPTDSSPFGFQATDGGPPARAAPFLLALLSSLTATAAALFVLR